MKSLDLKKLKFLLLLVLVLPFLLIGCDKIPFLSDLFKPKGREPQIDFPVVEGTVLARVDNWAISLEEFNERLRNLAELAPEFKIETFNDKKAFLEEMIRQQLLVQEAKSRGLDRKGEVVEAVKEFERGVLVREIVLQITEGVNVDAKEIEDYYNQFKEAFKEPMQYRASEIVVDTEHEANQILIDLLRGADFASNARLYSKSETASKGGDLGTIEQWPFPQFDIVIATLEIGKVSNVFKGPEGYYIVKLREKKGGRQRTLSEVWDEIKPGLIILKQNQTLQDLIARLRQNSKVDIYENLLR